jgi:hypothetical protein
MTEFCSGRDRERIPAMILAEKLLLLFQIGVWKASLLNAGLKELRQRTIFPSVTFTDPHVDLCRHLFGADIVKEYQVDHKQARRDALAIFQGSRVLVC